MYWNYIHVKLKFTYKHIHVLFRFITDLLNSQIYHDKKNCTVEIYIHALERILLWKFLYIILFEIVDCYYTQLEWYNIDDMKRTKD